MTFTHAIFIDESGTGCHKMDINSFWVSVAFAVPFDKMSTLEIGVKDIITSHFRKGISEVKGSAIPKQLVPGITVDSFVGDMGELWDNVGGKAWVVGSRDGVNPPVGYHGQNPLAKEIVRQILLERVSGYLDAGYGGPGSYLIVWDISDLRELIDFSKNTSVFQNGINGKPINNRLAPAILGGLSHDWGGLQFADLIAHCSLHQCACLNKGLNIPFNQEKKDAFDNHVYPRLVKDGYGNTVGWKYW